MARIILNENLREQIRQALSENTNNLYDWACDFCNQINQFDLKKHEQTKNLKAYPEELCYFLITALRYVNFIRRVTNIHPSNIIPLVDALCHNYIIFQHNNALDESEDAQPVVMKLYIGITIGFTINALRYLSYENDDLFVTELLQILNQHDIAAPYSFVHPITYMTYFKVEEDEIYSPVLDDCQYFITAHECYIHEHIRDLCALVTSSRRLQRAREHKSEQLTTTSENNATNNELLRVLKDIAQSLKQRPSEVHNHFHSNVNQYAQNIEHQDLKTK